MTVEMPQVMVITGDSEDTTVGDITFCELHEAEIRMALIERGFSQDCELTPEERADALIKGQPDALVVVKNQLVMASLSVFGGDLIMQYKGCPVCTFHSVIDQAADGVAMARTRKN